ncbi:MAG: serine phosphatase RsbU (regulator of sigma subunit) [Crocinitomix sp.]
MLAYCYANKVRYWKACKKKAREALTLSETIEYDEGRGLALLELGYQNWFRDNLTMAHVQLAESCAILRSTNNEFMFARATAVRASIYWTKGDRNKSISLVFEALRIIGANNKDALWLEWFLGIFYFDLQDYKNSEFQYLKALAIINNSKRETPDAYAYCIIGLGGVLMKTARQEQAIEHFENALLFCQENGFWMQEARVLHELGHYYEGEGKHKEALSHYRKSYVIRDKQQTKPALISSLLSLSRITAKTDNNAAITLALKALKFADSIHSKPKRLACHKVLSNLQKITGNFKQSHAHLEEVGKLRDELAGNETNASLKNLEKDFLEELFKRERDSLFMQNKELERANQIIKTQYNEIADSINYAKKIQNAILPTRDLIKEHLPDSFLVYKPKAGVSGDFYWLESINEDQLLFAVADCTGHGVPGAMTSMLCIGALNRAVREFKLTEPGAVLDKAREIIISDFDKSSEELHDGMDISLCLLNTKSLKLQWSGAFNPLWIVRNEANEVQHYFPDKQPIGNYPIYTPFNTEFIQLNKGDQIFIFSDGFADQFGGDKNKKYTSKRFKGLVEKNAHLPINTQKEIIINTFIEWKGQNDQIDDICLMGVRV